MTTAEEYRLYYSSPIGTLALTGSESGLSALDFLEESRENREPIPGFFKPWVGELDEYFRGIRREFTLPLAVEGTDFERQVWGQLLRIPYGETTSYIAIAEELGNPGAVRAVGNTNRKNRIAIVIPCHRVIGSDGDLIGYAGGLWRKRWLLEHEGGLRQQSLGL